jgi:uncharacterized protein YjiS (DUF1127 family)
MADSGSTGSWRLANPAQKGAHARLAAACETILAWIERSRQRRQLATLSDASLKDLNITRVDAEAEYRKRFWQE